MFKRKKKPVEKSANEKAIEKLLAENAKLLKKQMEALA